jgi:hypothetical protein
MLAFVLTMTGLAALAWTREPEPPNLRPQRSLRHGLVGVPALLRDDPAFTRYCVARALATMGRMALPFYILYVHPVRRHDPGAHRCHPAAARCYRPHG